MLVDMLHQIEIHFFNPQIAKGLWNFWENLWEEEIFLLPEIWL